MSEESDMQVKVVCQTLTNYEITIFFNYSDLQTYCDFIFKIYSSLSCLGLGDLNILLGQAYLKEVILYYNEFKQEEIFITEISSQNWEKILIQYFDNHVDVDYLSNKDLQLYILFKIGEVEFSSKIKREISHCLVDIFKTASSITESAHSNKDPKCIINNLSILKECKETLEKMKIDYIVVKKAVSELKASDSSIKILLEIVFEAIKEFEVKTKRLEKSLKRTRISTILANL
jgi:hypothetical protein